MSDQQDDQDEFDPGDDLWLAVWLPVSNPLLRDDVSAPFQALGEAVGELLERQGLGYFEGAISGSANVNLSFTLDPARDSGEAARVVIASLKERGLEARAIVARCRGFARPEVLWPPGYQGPLPR